MISKAFSLKEISGVSTELLVLEGRLPTEDALDGVKTSTVMTATKFGSITSADSVSLPSYKRSLTLLYSASPPL